MSVFKGHHLPTGPRWDGSRVLFQIEVAGLQVPCAISRAALEEVSGNRRIPSSDLLRRFANSRGQIERIAAQIFAVRPENITGRISIWSEDVEDPPVAPAIASQVPQSLHT